VLVPVDGGVFSALGLAAAERRSDEIRTVLLSEDRITPERLEGLIGDADEVRWDVRYQGQSFELSVAGVGADPGLLREIFESAHEERYGYREARTPIELVTVRRRYLAPGPEITIESESFEPGSGPDSIDLGEATLFLPDGWSATGGSAGVIRLRREQP
jgi:N-methylhydantoinase A/oxoprolinase/acetone carboxylase beta subunit